MKMKILKFIMFFVIISSSLQASNQYTHGVGVAAGFVTGYGLSYRFLQQNNAYQITFAPYVTSSFSVLSLGFAFIHTLHEADFTDLLMYTGVHCLYNDSVNDEWGNPRTSIRINVGFGPGIRFKLSEHVCFDIMFGYAIYNEINEPFSLNFTGETGLFYYF